MSQGERLLERWSLLVMGRGGGLDGGDESVWWCGQNDRRSKGGLPDPHVFPSRKGGGGWNLGQ